MIVPMTERACDSAPSVALVSLGCPKNLVDSERMLGVLAEGGCMVGAPMEDADVIVVNTCGFLSAARDEAMEVIAEAMEHKRGGRARRVVVAGCLVNRDAEDLFDAAPGIDAIMGVNDREGILAAVLGEGPETRLSAAGAAPDDRGRFRLTAPHTAYLRISAGCSRRCTFCAIPAIRGPFRSKPREQVLTEARELIDSGAVELNIIGQDTTGYGRDLGGEIGLGRLLTDLNGLPGIGWLRLLYAYPSRFGEDLLSCMASAEHVVPYVDVPLQHISDPVLKAMGRGVGRGEIERLLETLRRRMPGMAVRTAFIVGFPGESDQQFEELLAFVRAARFDAMGVFEYSPEEGTAAASVSGAVPDEVKAERAEAIMLAQQEIAFAANGNAVGKRLELLVDGTGADGRCIARHAGQAPDIDSVCYLTEPRGAGEFGSGRVVDWDDYDLIVEAERT